MEDRQSSSSRSLFIFLAYCLLSTTLLFPLTLLSRVDNSDTLTIDIQKRIDRIEKEIGERKEGIKEREKKEKTILKEIEDLDREIESLERSLTTLSMNEKVMVSELERIKKDIEAINQKIEGGKDLLKERLRFLYRVSKRGVFNMVLSSLDDGSILRGLRYIMLLLKRDLHMVEEFRSAIDLKDILIHRKREDIRKTDELRRKIMKKKEEIETGKAVRQHLIARIKKEKALYQRVLAELEESSIELSKTLKRVSSERRERDREVGIRDSFTSLKGRHIFPVHGRITEYFGRYQAPEMKAPIFRKGIDITAPTGTEFYAIYDGVVKVARWFKGYGILIIIDHGESYFSVYAHAQRIVVKQGDRVKRGDIIGFVGDTGSLKGPYLYFEIRHRETPVDPLEWVEVPPDAIE